MSSRGANPKLRRILGKQTPHTPAFPRVAPVAPRTLSLAQTRLWFVEQYAKRTGLNTVSRAFRIAGPLDETAFDRAVQSVGARHEALRWSVLDNRGEPTVIVRDRVPEVAFIPSDEAEAQARCAALANEPMPLDGPLFDVHVFVVSDALRLVLIRWHHLIIDGWSIDLVLQDLSECYRGVDLTDAPGASYADYVAWQSGARERGDWDQDVSFWRDVLAGAPPVLALPTDRPRPPERGHHGRLCTESIPAQTFARVRAAASALDVSLFSFVLAALQLVLSRLAAEPDVVVATPVAARNHSALHDVVGLVANTVAVRTQVDERETVRNFVTAVHRSTGEALTHQLAPFERVVEALQPPRDPSFEPVAQVMFTLQTARQRLLEDASLQQARVSLPRTFSRNDLTLFAIEHEGALRLEAEYASELFDESSVSRWLQFASVVLAEFARDDQQAVAQVRLQNAEQIREEVQPLSGEIRYQGSSAVHTLVERIAAANPDAPAIAGAVAMSYGELNKRANCLAGALLDAGVAPGSRVAFALEARDQAIVAMLGILKVGACYVPLQAEDPRSAAMVREARANVGVAAHPDALHGCRVLVYEDAIASEDRGNPGIAVDAASEAYVMFTSGSTGTPKGVVVPHRAVASLVQHADYVPFGADAVFAQLAPLTFDAATFEVWGALTHGATLALAPSGIVPLDVLADLLTEHRVSHAFLTTGLFNALVDERVEALSGLRHVLVGGEVMSVPHMRKAQESCPRVQFANVYGPTETTTFATIQKLAPPLDERGQVPIGRALASRQAFVLDADRNPVPLGVPGELWVAGCGVALGYLDGMRDAFAPLDGLCDGLAYRTGDWVRMDPEGRLHFLGRKDAQVKVRGHRIEPAEVERALLQIKGIEQAVVLSHRQPGSTLLVGFYVGQTYEPSHLRAQLMVTLPNYLVPDRFICLTSMPHTANGKVDHGQLRACVGQVGATETQEAAQTETERWLLALWSELLGEPLVDPTVVFFDVGGHSLLAVRMMSRIEREFAVQIPLATLFRASTVRELAEIIDRGGVPELWSPLVPISEGVGAPLYLVHPAGGHVLGFSDIGQSLRCPLVGVQAFGVEAGQAPHEDVREMARTYVEAIRDVQPHGPYRLGGVSFGGVVAFEMAAQLEAEGETVDYLMIGDTCIQQGRHVSGWRARFGRWTYLANYLKPALFVRLFQRSGGSEGAEYANDSHRRMHEAHAKAMLRYEPEPITAELHLVVASHRYRARLRAFSMLGPKLGWDRLTAGRVRKHVLNGEHNEIFYGERARTLAELMEQVMLGR